MRQFETGSLRFHKAFFSFSSLADDDCTSHRDEVESLKSRTRKGKKSFGFHHTARERKLNDQQLNLNLIRFIAQWRPIKVSLLSRCINVRAFPVGYFFRSRR